MQITPVTRKTPKIYPTLTSLVAATVTATLALASCDSGENQTTQAGSSHTEQPCGTQDEQWAEIEKLLKEADKLLHEIATSEYLSIPTEFGCNDIVISAKKLSPQQQQLTDLFQSLKTATDLNEADMQAQTAQLLSDCRALLREVKKAARAHTACQEQATIYGQHPQILSGIVIDFERTASFAKAEVEHRIAFRKVVATMEQAEHLSTQDVKKVISTIQPILTKIYDLRWYGEESAKTLQDKLDAAILKAAKIKPVQIKRPYWVFDFLGL